jgi:hypothetical protein
MVKSKAFLKTRQGHTVLGLLSLVAAWLIFIRAVDTGSLQQYALLIVLLVFGINRLFRSIFPKQA